LVRKGVGEKEDAEVAEEEQGISRYTDKSTQQAQSCEQDVEVAERKVQSGWNR